MAVDLDAVANRLFAGVMAPLVLGGAVAPGHAIGGRTAMALGDGRTLADRGLAAQVDLARLRRARRLVPVDVLPEPGTADWALAAAFNDLLQAANPVFDAALRRGAAVRILDLAAETIDRVAAPATVGEALSRHSWLARVPEVTRTDTTVRWWAGAREYLGVEPPDRLQAWPQLRRVQVVRRPRALLELEPIAVDRDRLSEVLTALLARTPLTDLATCTREAPPFAWRASSLGFIGAKAGRALALRALVRLPRAEVDVALGRATRSLLALGRGDMTRPALSLLADRALMEAAQPGDAEGGEPRDVTFAHALGALVAREALAADGARAPGDRARVARSLTRAAQSRAPEAREARELFERAGGASGIVLPHLR